MGSAERAVMIDKVKVVHHRATLWQQACPKGSMYLYGSYLGLKGVPI